MKNLNLTATYSGDTIFMNFKNLSDSVKVYLVQDYLDYNLDLSNPKKACIKNMRGRRALPKSKENACNDNVFGKVIILEPKQETMIKLDMNVFYCEKSKHKGKINGKIEIACTSILNEYCSKFWTGTIVSEIR